MVYIDLENKSFHYKATSIPFCILFKCEISYTSVLNSSRASLEISCCKNFLTATSYIEKQIAMMQQKQHKDGNGIHFKLIKSIICRLVASVQTFFTFKSKHLVQVWIHNNSIVAITITMCLKPFLRRMNWLNCSSEH